MQCGKELCLHMPTTKSHFDVFIIRYVTYCIKLINLLLENGVFPIVVFDGADLPIKEGTNIQRKEYITLVIRIM